MTSEYRSSRFYRRDLSYKLFRISVYALLIIGVIVVIVPFLWMISTSLKSLSDTLSPGFHFFPEKIVWSNYARVWELLPFGRFVVNSFIVSVSVTTIQILTSSLAAYAFSRLRWRGRDALFVLYLSSLMLPMQIAMIPNFFTLRVLNMIDTHASVILPQSFTVFGTFLLRQFFMTIPNSLQDAATIDGCSNLRIYWQIIMPLAKPGLLTLGVFSFMFSWNNFLWPLIMLNTRQRFTLPLGIVSFQGQFGTDWPVMMAAAFQSLIPVLVIYSFAQKRFIEGVAMSGLKG